MPKKNDTLRVLLISAIGTSINPYISLLGDGLAAAGAEVRLTDRLDPAELAGDKHPDVIHLHWLDRYDVPSAILFLSLHGAKDLPRRALRRILETACNLPTVYQLRRWGRLRRLLVQLRGFQAGGGRVAYTVHNLDPHEESGWAEEWGIRQLIKLADVIHVHDASTAEVVAARFGRRTGIAVIPHGHYLPSYPNAVSRQEARAHLDLPDDAFVFLTLGLMRPYKGLEELIPTFRALVGEDIYLVIAGRPNPESYIGTLAGLAAGDPRIRLLPRFIPPADIQTYFNAADICVLPYRQATTSGTVLLAFSFGVPVIAPAIGAFPSLIQANRGILYVPAQPDGLAQALIQARQTNWEGTRQEIMAWVAQFDWEEIGRQLIAAYVREAE